MGAKVIIFGKILHSNFLKGLRHSAMVYYSMDELVSTESVESTSAR